MIDWEVNEGATCWIVKSYSADKSLNKYQQTNFSISGMME